MSRRTPRPAVGPLTRAFVLVIVGVGIGTAVSAQESAPLAATSPLWLGHLRPEGLEVEFPDRGWTVHAGVAYGNTFSISPELLQLHREAGRTGEALDPSELAEARGRWPEAGLHAVDTEVVRLNVAASVQGDRWFGGGRISSWRLGGTALDRWPDAVHDAWGLSDQGRPLFPDGQSLVAVLPSGSPGWAQFRGDGARLVDATAWVGRCWATGSGRRHRLWLTVSRPVTNELTSETSSNAGLRWAYSKRWSGSGFHGGVGWTVQGGRAGDLGPASETWHGWLGADVDLGRGWSALVTARVDQSVFADVAPAKPGRATGAFAFGVGIPLPAAGWRLRLSFGEDFPGMGIPPDFSIQSALQWRPGERSR